jgi:hypothetical protein
VEHVNYLMSQSRVLASVGEGKESPEAVRRWLTDVQASFFKRPGSKFVIKGSIDYLRRDAPTSSRTASVVR